MSELARRRAGIPETVPILCPFCKEDRCVEGGGDKDCPCPHHRGMTWDGDCHWVGREVPK